MSPSKQTPNSGPQIKPQQSYGFVQTVVGVGVSRTQYLLKKILVHIWAEASCYSLVILDLSSFSKIVAPDND